MSIPEGVCDPKKESQKVLLHQLLSMPQQSTTPQLQNPQIQRVSTQRIPVCDPKKDPTCPATSTTINTTAEYNTSATESTREYNTNPTEYRSVSVTGCMRSQERSHMSCSSATISTTAEYTPGTSTAQESKKSVLQNPLRPQIPVSCYINYYQYHRSIQSSSVKRVHPKKDPLSCYRIHSRVQCLSYRIHRGGVTQERSTCPATSATINTTAEYNASSTESTVSASTTERVCDPKKDPTCPAKSTTINTTAEYNTSATESTVSVSTTRGVCNPKKDSTCPATSTTINTTVEYNTSAEHNTTATESTEVSVPEGVYDPKKDPTCPATSTTINTTAEYNTSATESTQSTTPQLQNLQQLAGQYHRGVCHESQEKNPTLLSTTINATAEIHNTSSYKIHKSTVAHREFAIPRKCDPKKEHHCYRNLQQVSISTEPQENPMSSINSLKIPQSTTPQYRIQQSTTPQLQNHSSCQYHRGVCDPKKDPMCPVTSSTINTNSRVQHLSYRNPQNVQSQERSHVSTSSATINTTAEYTTSQLQNPVTVSTAEVCDPKKRSHVSCYVNYYHYHTSVQHLN
ncbi:uncharacterized protein [Macrobrachium rosenbergii]|uniref:uncharacterized protein n=1 Tax=Macrobrachium rosenbergii TaxID=79674 RepID=UPI0034D75F45